MCTFACEKKHFSGCHTLMDFQHWKLLALTDRWTPGHSYAPATSGDDVFPSTLKNCVLPPYHRVQKLFQGHRNTQATSPCCLTKQRRGIAALLSRPSLVFQQTCNKYLPESWKKCSGVTFTNCNLLPSWWSPDKQDCRPSCEGAAPLHPALSPAPLPSAKGAAPGRRFAEKPGVPKRNPEQMAAVAVQPQKGTFKSK